MKFSIDFSPFSKDFEQELILFDQQFFSMPWTLAQWAPLFEESPGQYFVLRSLLEGHLIGFCLFQCIELEKLGHLLKIVVDPGYQGKGFGSQLLGKSIEQLEKAGFNSFFLEVEQSNMVARSLYRSNGFLELNRLKDFYGAGRHGVAMRRN